MKKAKTGVKIVIFLAVAAVIFAGVNYLLQPIWPEWNNHNSTHDYYEEPENTIETLFLGSSVTGVGVIPMQLYEDYGICAYNGGTESQPVMASYYLAESVYKRNSETLDTIVLDAAMLRKTPRDTMYIKILDSLRPSMIKYHFMKDFSGGFTDFLSHLIPIISYHDRWKELSDEDFRKAGYDLALYTRGHYFVTDSRLEKTDDYTEITTPNYIVEDLEVTELNGEALKYFNKLAEFCDNNGIKLVLIKTPHDDWTDGDHNAAEALAEENNIDFFDFNYAPYTDEIDYNGAVDRKDAKHLNYYGAVKLTDWLGKYLTEECGNRDVRGDEKYAYMEDELEDFHREILSVELEGITDPAEYLSELAGRDDYLIIISARDDASKSITDEQRDEFAGMGLVELSEISYRESYLAVINDGSIIELSQPDDKEYIASVNADGERELYLSFEGKLSPRVTYSVISGGTNMGNISSIVIDGTEYSESARGLNIIVYDKKLDLVTDTAVFDTYASSERSLPVNEANLRELIESGGTEDLTGKWLELYQYDQLREETKTEKLLEREAGD